MLFIYINIDEEDNSRVLEFFGLKADECPTYRYIHLGDDMQKYRPDTSDITADAVTTFVDSILDGRRQVLVTFWTKCAGTVLHGVAYSVAVLSLY